MENLSKDQLAKECYLYNIADLNQKSTKARKMISTRTIGTLMILVGTLMVFAGILSTLII